MSGGKRQNQRSFERMRKKQAARRPEHHDKYADRVVESKLGPPQPPFNGEVANHA